MGLSAVCGGKGILGVATYSEDGEVGQVESCWDTLVAFLIKVSKLALSSYMTICLRIWGLRPIR